MSQAPMTIGADKTGLQYRTEDNSRAGALATLSKGNAAPTDATGGRVWLDDSATPWKLKVYDGADWITLGEINHTTNAFTPYIGVAAARLLNQAAETGAADAYAIAPTPAISAYVLGQILTLRPVNANTGPSTIAVGGLAAKAIKLNTGADLHAGALQAGGAYMLVYDGAAFQLMNPSWPFGTAAFANVLNEADMVSYSPTNPPSQQSVVDYIDSIGLAAGWEILAAGDLTGLTALDFELPAGYTEFELAVYDAYTNVTVRKLLCRVSLNGGTSYVTGGYQQGYKKISGTGVTDNTVSTTGFILSGDLSSDLPTVANGTHGGGSGIYKFTMPAAQASSYLYFDPLPRKIPGTDVRIPYGYLATNTTPPTNIRVCISNTGAFQGGRAVLIAKKGSI